MNTARRRDMCGTTMRDTDSTDGQELSEMDELHLLQQLLVELRETDDGLERTLEAFVDRIPQAFRNPEETGIRIEMGEFETSAGFEAVERTIEEAVTAEDGERVSVSVGSAPATDETEELPSTTEVPFGARERTLVKTLVAIVSSFYEGRAHVELLDESEQRFRHLAESIDDVFWITDAATERLVYVNPAYEELWGRSRESLYADPTSFLEYVHPEDRKRVEAARPRQVTGEYDIEYRVVRPDGTIRWVKDRAFPIHEGDSVTRIVGVARDITENKLARLELEEHLDRIQDAFIAVDTAARFTYVNETAEELFDADRPSLEGECLWNVFPAEQDSKLAEKLREAVGTQESVTFHHEFETLDPLFELSVYPSETGLSIYIRDVTDDRRRERELERYETTLEALGDPVYALDADGRFTYVNEALLELTGYERSELLGEHATKIVPQESIDRGQRAIEEMLGEDEPHTSRWEIVLQPKDGELIPYENHLALLPREDGNFRGSVGIARDIRERRDRERELERYEATLEALGDPVYAIDRNGCFTYVNEALVEKTGYEVDELLGEHISIVMRDHHVEEGRDIIQGLIKGEHQGRSMWEMDLVTRDGEFIPCENNVELLPFEDGEFVGTAGVIRDVSELKERELELTRRRDHLVRTERMADVGGWELDVKSGTVNWTAGCRAIFGADGTELTLGETLEFFHPEDRDTLGEAIDRCIEEQIPYDLEVRIQTAEGRERWIRTRGEHVTADGVPKLRGAVHDITDEKEREQQLMVLNRVLRHNLRNNLNVVTANAELIKRQLSAFEAPATVNGGDPATLLEEVLEQLPEEQRAEIRPFQSYLETVTDFCHEEVRAKLDQMEDNAWELLGLSDKARRLAETLGQADSTETVDLQPLLVGLAAEYEARYPGVDISVDGTAPEIPAQSETIRLVFTELLENAIEHTDSDRIELQLQNVGQRVAVSVADQGTGIPEMEVRALERGYESALEHGSGLGLWTVNWLLTRLGGSVSIEANDADGSVVRVALPTVESAGRD